MLLYKLTTVNEGQLKSTAHHTSCIIAHFDTLSLAVRLCCDNWTNTSN